MAKRKTKAKAKRLKAKKAPKKKKGAKGKKRSASPHMKRALKDVTTGLEEMKAKLREMAIEDGEDIDQYKVQSAKEFAERMADINRGIREALKNAMMAEGKIKPGQVLTVRDRRVFLKPRPGCKKGSMNPDDYDLAYEMIH